MSIKTWKENFYSRPLKKFTKVQAIEHSLRKWEGLTRENLKKHDLYITKTRQSIITDGIEQLQIGSDTCALCHKYLYNLSNGVAEVCAACPLYKTLGKGCGDGDDGDPFTMWMEQHNPNPMIKSLKKCLEENSSE